MARKKKKPFFLTRKHHTIFYQPQIKKKKHDTSDTHNKNYFRRPRRRHPEKQTWYYLTLQKLLRLVSLKLYESNHTRKWTFEKTTIWQNKNKQLLEIQYILYFIEFLGNSILYRLWLFSNDPTCEPGYLAMCI